MIVTDVDYPSTLLASYIFTMLSQCVGLYRDRLFAEKVGGVRKTEENRENKHT